MRNPNFCPSGVIFRIYVCGLAIASWFVGNFEGRSLTSLLAQTDGGSVVLNLMLACGIVGLVDVLLNDFAPACFQVDYARRHRHFVLAALAFCYVCHVFVAVLSIKSWWMAAFNLWNALAIVAFSFIDAQQRSKVSTCPLF